MFKKILDMKKMSKEEIINLGNDIVQSKDARNIFLYAKYSPYLDTDIFTKAIIETNDKKYIHYFTRTIKSINYDILLDKMIEFQDPALLFYVTYDTKDFTDKHYLKIAQSLYSLNNHYFFNRFMYYYFCILKRNYIEIYQLLQRGLIKQQVNVTDLTLQNCPSFLDHLKEKLGLQPLSKIPENTYSPNCYHGRNQWIPDMIVCHITSDYNKALNMFYNKDSNVSSHFVIAKDGTSKQVISLKDSAWANGTSLNEHSDVYYKLATNSLVKERKENANYYTFSIEHESYDGHLTDAQRKESIRLMKKIIDFIQDEYHIDFNIDRNHIVGHNEVNPIPKPNCPGKNFPFDQIIQELKKIK